MVTHTPREDLHRLEAPEEIYLQRLYDRDRPRSPPYRSREDGAYDSADPDDSQIGEPRERDERAPEHRRTNET